MATPEKRATSRHPKVVRAQAIAGAARPPRPMPAVARPTARARRRSNQLTMVVVSVRKPASPDPRAIRANAP